MMVDRQRGESAAGLNVFQPGTLLDRVRVTSQHALRTGALEPIETKTSYYEECGFRFLIRILSTLRNKPRGDDHHNPFLPYEEPLYVADASASHVCILNKYKVVDLHLLIITRAFEHQESPLTEQDFAALWRCLPEYESLGFYNSGTLAGASQLHKHLQLVPLPLVETRHGAAATVKTLLDTQECPAGEVTQTNLFPFRHAFVRFATPKTTDPMQLANQAFDCYHRMMHQVGIDVLRLEQGCITMPYNLLISHRWMLLVPRLRECFDAISFNALAFLGAMLVHDEKQLERLCQTGPLYALQAVTMPR